MAAKFQLTVEFPDEKVKAVEEATERFAKAQEDLFDATVDLRRSLWAMRDSLTVKKEDDDG